MEAIATIKLDSNFSSTFHKNVVAEITQRIKKESVKIISTITDKLRNAVRDSVMATEEYQSIVHGKLRAELGIPDPNGRIITIIDTWVNNIMVDVKAGTSPLLLITIGILQDDYGDVLSLPQAQYTYQSHRSKGEIPWLKWLLLEGDTRLVTTYEFSSNPRGSRTGMGIMVNKERGFWQVPPEFSGTSVDNFATRALGNIQSVLDTIVEQAVRGAFK